ncbi:MAG: hypothetical protein KDA45_14055, partial [Planctomycetales bacterium]|nr:hypothetical protein [Planctomycetales bacterium]
MSSRGEQVLIAANPKSGSVSSRQRVADLRQALTDRGFGCHVCHSLEQVQQESLRLQQGGCLRAVVSAGGDGTADALTNLLPSHLPLLVFPLGTENLLAKYLGIHGDVRQACDILQADQRLAIDVGRANGQLFLVMLSCGFDAEVVRQMHARRTGHINRWSYTRPIYSALRNYRFQQLRFETDAPQAASEHWPLDAAAWLFVFNIPRYAASLNFCPQADPCDGLLDVCLFQRSGIL